MTVFLSVVKVVGKVLEIFFAVKDSGNDFLNGLRICEILWILFEDLFDGQHFAFFNYIGVSVSFTALIQRV